MFSAPAAPAPRVTNKMPINESNKGIVVGDVNNPTAQVKITKDITLGFISSNKIFEYAKKLNFEVSDLF
jgi:protein-disulfide isomerase